MEEIAGLRRQQEKFAQELGNLREEHEQSDKACAGEMEAIRKQQSESQARFVQDLANLKQQFAHLSGAHSSSEKKVADLGTQLTQAK
jgi:chromosome segregation ATPase